MDIKAVNQLMCVLNSAAIDDASFQNLTSRLVKVSKLTIWNFVRNYSFILCGNTALFFVELLQLYIA